MLIKSRFLDACILGFIVLSTYNPTLGILCDFFVYIFWNSFYFSTSFFHFILVFSHHFVLKRMKAHQKSKDFYSLRAHAYLYIFRIARTLFL